MKIVTPERLNALSDGVIAIALTLLVLGIDIPEDHNFDENGLLSFLIKLEPALVAYVMSFIIVALYWFIHHRIFNELKYINTAVIALNIIFLFSISLVPFISKLKSLYRYDAMVVAIFAMAHIFTGLILYFTWKYVSSYTELLEAPEDHKAEKRIAYEILIIPIICVLAIPIAHINIHWGTYFFALIPVVYAILLRKKA